jgi:large subunit ribosomal protein L19
MKASKLTRETIRHVGVYDRGFPAFKAGDTIAVVLRIKERDKDGFKERLQTFEGDVISIRRLGAATTFTVRKISANAVAVERIFPMYSPLIDSITFIREGRVRRAKQYYIRERIGKAARVKRKKLQSQQHSESAE